MRVDLLVELKTVDLVRETAWQALREGLGWGETLVSLKRAVLWRLAGEAASESALREAFAAQLERSSAFYNPNKERCRLLAEGELGGGEPIAAETEQAGSSRGAGSTAAAFPAAGSPPNAGALWRAQVWITDEGGERPGLLRRLGDSLREPGVRAETLREGVYWDLRLRAADRGQAEARVNEIVVTRDRHRGLLLNPHYQEARLLALTREEPA